MGHGTGGGGGTRLGVFCAIVLVAVLALAHGIGTPGAGLVVESDPDRCAVGIPRLMTPAFVGEAQTDGSIQAGTPSDTGGDEHEPAVGTARTGAMSRPRPASIGSFAPVAVEAVVFRLAGSTEAGEAAVRAGLRAPGGAPARTDVLRC
jgi:hypothetical protein